MIQMKKRSSCLLAVAVCVFSLTMAQTDLSCNLLKDNACPSRNDGVCDSELGLSPKPGCQGGDCADCDQWCPQYVDDCGGCVAHGCYWCPSDGTCFNSPHYNNQHLTNIFSTCRAPDDFEQTCSSNAANAANNAATHSDFTVTLNSNTNVESNFFQDPLYDGQSWVYDMIHVLPVWQQGIFGSSVRVRVNDNGVDATHHEFGDRFDALASCDAYLPNYNTTDGLNYHGTAVAAILGAEANNNECSVGIAPQVTLSSCNLFQYRTDSFLAEKLDQFDISQNSFGYPACGPGRQRHLQEPQEEENNNNNNTCPFAYRSSFTNPCTVCEFGDDDDSFATTTKSTKCQTTIVQHCRFHYEKDVAACLQFLDWLLPDGQCDYNVLSRPSQDALAKGILQGRDGKGIIFVFASGNSFAFGDDTNFKGYTNSRLIISVGSVGKDGLHASYSTPGASLFLTAPGGDHETTTNHMTANIGGGCRDAGVGTSFACPVVSGVVALVLETNPELTWRDVQGLLATTSRMVLANDPYQKDSSLVKNAAGLSHSNLYGFGIVDAQAAVEAAKTWELYATEKRLIGDSGILNLALVDDASTLVMSTISLVPATDEFLVESVEVYVDLQHWSRGDLEIVLESPQGTQSVLHPGNRPENTVLGENDRWKLLTVRAWGESAQGDWTMVIRDMSPGYALSCADAPWTFLFVDGFILDCDYAHQQEFCVDGDLHRTEENTEQLDLLLSFIDRGRTIAEACCICGGGLSTNNSEEAEDQLRQWQIVVYGREVGNPYPSSVPSKAPIAVPTRSLPFGSIELPPPPMPSQNPSTIPSQNPSTTASPTSSSAPSPTPSTSSAPSRMPTIAPSTTPSSAPSLDPSASPSTSPSVGPSQVPSKLPSSMPSTTPSTMPSLPPPTLTPGLVEDYHVRGSRRSSGAPGRRMFRCHFGLLATFIILVVI